MTIPIWLFVFFILVAGISGALMSHQKTVEGFREMNWVIPKESVFAEFGMSPRELADLYTEKQLAAAKIAVYRVSSNWSHTAVQILEHAHNISILRRTLLTEEKS